jgi:predicted DsbA family dithiol-disulfide isomerase
MRCRLECASFRVRRVHDDDMALRACSRSGAAGSAVTRSYVEVFADVVCPFAHVGLRRFAAFRRANESNGPALRVRAWPLELVNGAPLATDLNVRHIDDLRQSVAPDLFSGFNRDAPPTSSLPALALAAAAYSIDDETGERISFAVRDAFFEEGLDVGDPRVLNRIAAAERVVLSSPEFELSVLDDFEESKRRGVRGSPEFFVNGRGWYCPSLNIDNVDGELRIEPDVESAEALLAECFA